MSYERLIAVIEDELIIYRDEGRTVPGLGDKFPNVWAYQFYADGSSSMEPRETGINVAASPTDYYALVRLWQAAGPNN